jgi:hypothetical protein
MVIITSNYWGSIVAILRGTKDRGRLHRIVLSFETFPSHDIMTLVASITHTFETLWQISHVVS